MKQIELPDVINLWILLQIFITRGTNVEGVAIVKLGLDEGGGNAGSGGVVQTWSDTAEISDV